MKRFLSILLSVAMVMSMMPMAFAESVSEDGWDFTAETVETADEAVPGTETELAADDEVSYSTDGGAENTSSLADAVAGIGTGTGTIKVKNDVTVTSELKITGNVTIVADGKDVTIKRGSTLTGAPVISVASGATLNLGTKTAMENTLTIDGGAVWNGNEGYPNTDADRQLIDPTIPACVEILQSFVQTELSICMKMLFCKITTTILLFTIIIAAVVLI